MSLKLHLLAATAAAAVALPASAQVTGTRLPVRTDAQAEVQANAQTETNRAADAQVQAQTSTQAEANSQAEAQASTEANAAADPQAPADASAQAGSQTQSAGAGQVVVATPADVRVGILVQDPQGGTVGTVESVDADGAVVSTGNVRAKLPLNSFGKNDRGLVISLTRAELEAAAAAQTQAEPPAQSPS